MSRDTRLQVCNGVAMRVEEKDAVSVFHVLEDEIFQKGSFAGALRAEDVQAGAALHVAYFDEVVYLTPAPKDDIRHGDRPAQESVIYSPFVILRPCGRFAICPLDCS